jgi:iron complex outermembrane receptor protein
VFSGLINNIFDAKIVSNGADYGGGFVYYFPQAGINFLAGVTLKF